MLRRMGAAPSCTGTPTMATGSSAETREADPRARKGTTVLDSIMSDCEASPAPLPVARLEPGAGGRYIPSAQTREQRRHPLC